MYPIVDSDSGRIMKYQISSKNDVSHYDDQFLSPFTKEVVSTQSIESGYRSMSPSNSTISSSKSSTSIISADDEESLSSTSSDITPTNSPQETAIQMYLPASPKSIPLTFCNSNYENYVNTFFDLFVDGLSLKEDIVYQIFNIEEVDALGFGIKSDRVVPCIRVFTKSPAESRKSILYKGAEELSAALLKQKNILLSIDDSTCCIEVSDFEDSKIYPEELMGYPGNQFKVKGGIERGTIGYYMVADLELKVESETKQISKHFAITCSHCVFPSSVFTNLMTKARSNEAIKLKSEQYPLAELCDHMWEHSRNRRYHCFFHHRTTLQGHPVAYGGFAYERELLMIKGSICCDEVRDLVNQSVAYEDDDNIPLTYVASKYGMIPRHFTMPLPSYIFKEPYHNGDVYHIPFSVDVAALELDTSLDSSHCLNALNSLIDGPISKSTHPHVFKSSHRQQIFPEFDVRRLPEYKTDISSALLDVDIQQPLSISSPMEDSLTAHPLHRPIDPSDIPEVSKIKNFLQEKVQKVSEIVVATGRNIFGIKEQSKLQLQVMSNQRALHDRRPFKRTVDVKNDQFCLEFIHRNQRNRYQKRTFPTVKWNYQKKQLRDTQDFIIPGDSGSALYVVTKDKDHFDKPVLLGVVGSANTATRVDFVRDVLSPDLLMYMTSSLKNSLEDTNPFHLLCQAVQSRIKYDTDFAELVRCPKLDICQRLQEKSHFNKSLETSTPIYSNEDMTTSLGSISFKLRECIKDCFL